MMDSSLLNDFKKNSTLFLYMLYIKCTGKKLKIFDVSFINKKTDLLNIFSILKYKYNSLKKQIYLHIYI